MPTLTTVERTQMARARARRALCNRAATWPPAMPDVEWTHEQCGTVWRTFQDGRGRWEWLISHEPDGCPHAGTVTRYDDGTIDCDDCSERLALNGVWGAY